MHGGGGDRRAPPRGAHRRADRRGGLGPGFRGLVFGFGALVLGGRWVPAACGPQASRASLCARARTRQRRGRPPNAAPPPCSPNPLCSSSAASCLFSSDCIPSGRGRSEPTRTGGRARGRGAAAPPPPDAPLQCARRGPRALPPCRLCAAAGAGPLPRRSSRSAAEPTPMLHPRLAPRRRLLPRASCVVLSLAALRAIARGYGCRKLCRFTSLIRPHSVISVCALSTARAAPCRAMQRHAAPSVRSRAFQSKYTLQYPLGLKLLDVGTAKRGWVGACAMTWPACASTAAAYGAVR
jgi:hypothetical protein